MKSLRRVFKLGMKKCFKIVGIEVCGPHRSYESEYPSFPGRRSATVLPMYSRGFLGISRAETPDRIRCFHAW